MTETARRGLQASDTCVDATLTDLPLLPRERIWGFWQHSSVNVGLAIATWAFLQGAAVAYYVGLAQAIATIVIGYGISVLAVALAPCLPSVKYGIEQFIGVRSTFGEVGARVVMIAVSTVLAAAWSAVLAIMFGHGLVVVANQLLGIELSQTGAAASILGLAAIVVSALILVRGPVSVEIVCRMLAPLLMAVLIGILVIVFTGNTWGELVALAPLGGAAGDNHLNFMLAVELSIAGGFAWWPNLGNLARLTRSSRAAFWPNWVGVFGASVIAAVVGSIAALSLQLDEPTQWFIPLAGVVLGMVALVIVCFANITAILSQGYASMVALKGGGGRFFHSLAWPWLVAAILGPAAILVFFPAAVYDNYGRFLSWGAIVLAPLCAVQIVDYFILRRRVLSVRDLFLPADQSAYGYWKGVNYVAFASVAVGAVTYSLLLNPVTYEPSELFRYTTASVPPFLIAGVTHYVLTRTVVQRLGMGGYA
ncbi:cytosine permease [Mycobacterium sp. NPDC003449]